MPTPSVVPWIKGKAKIDLPVFHIKKGETVWLKKSRDVFHTIQQTWWVMGKNSLTRWSISYAGPECGHLIAKQREKGEEVTTRSNEKLHRALDEQAKQRLVTDSKRKVAFRGRSS